MRSLRTLAAAAFFLFLAMAVPAAASGVRVSTHNRTCTVPSPDPNDANWWLTSIVSVGDYFLLSADYAVTLSNKSRLYLLDPSSCTVVSSAVVPQKGGCDSVLQNTQSEWVVALFCPIDSSGCAPTNSLYSITVGVNGALVLNGTTFRSNRKPTGCFLNSPVAGADGLMYFFSGPSNFENDFTLVSYDAVSNKVTLLANYTALNGIDDTLVAMSPDSDRFVVARGTAMSSSAEWAVFDSSTGEEVGTVSDGRDLQQAYVMSGGVTVVVGSADSASTEVATLSWTTYKLGKTDQIGGLTSSELYYFAPYGADTLLLQGTDESGDVVQLVQLSVASNPPHTVSEVTLTGSSGGPMAATSGFLGVLNGSSMSLEIYKLSA